MQERKLVRAALLLAIAVLIQQIRLLVPLPVLVSTLLIGTVVNACLALAARLTSLSLALEMTLLLPIIAFLQGHLLLAMLIPVVFLGNAVFVLCCCKLRWKLLLLAGPLLKTGMMILGTTLVIKLFHIAPNLGSKIILTMTWPQLVTGVLGLLLGGLVENRLQAGNKTTSKY